MSEKHPKSLRIFFATEMWERFNYYGMRSLLILYMTAAVREDGDINFYRDIYGYDAQLRQALDKGYPYPR